MTNTNKGKNITNKKIQTHQKLYSATQQQKQ